MYKQNRGLMTTQTKQTTSNQVDFKHIIQEIANDYSEMYNASAHNPIKDILNQLLMFGEEEGVLVTTAIQKLYECNKEYKEGV